MNCSAIGRSKSHNPQLRAETTLPEFVALRSGRDAALEAPRLIYQSVQVNADAGRLPTPHANGHRYLVLPLNLRSPTDDVGQAK